MHQRPAGLAPDVETIARSPGVADAIARMSKGWPVTLTLAPQPDGQRYVLLVRQGDGSVSWALEPDTACSAAVLDAFAYLHRLTQREREVLQQLVAGTVPKKIAVALGLSVDTVRTHIHSILQKSGERRIGSLVLRLFRLSSLGCLAGARPAPPEDARGARREP